jgi:uncharacterized membrane protein YfcA
MIMAVEYILLILVAGIGAGFINSMAGGGSLLTMPVLIFLGLPSATANGTNRIALIFQNLAGIATFHRKGFFDWKLGLLLSIPAVIGSIIGANLAITVPDGLFNKILAVVMFIVVGFVVWQPEKRLSKKTKDITGARKIAAFIVFFFVGLYGGFIQIGIGFVIIASLTLIFGMSLLQVNAIKLFVGLIYLFASFIVFLVNGEVDGGIGLTLAIGNSIGAWAGSQFAISKGEKWIRVVLIVAVALMGAKLLGLFDLFA